MDTQELFMTFKLLKRRYRSTEGSDKLRRLDYFNQPFEENSEIRLKDDLDLPNPLALESLSTQFEAVYNKRGSQNAANREDKNTDKKKQKGFESEDPDLFNPFDVGNSKQF